VFVFPKKWEKNDRLEKKLVTMTKYYDLYSVYYKGNNWSHRSDTLMMAKAWTQTKNRDPTIPDNILEKHVFTNIWSARYQMCTQIQ